MAGMMKGPAKEKERNIYANKLGSNTFQALAQQVDDDADDEDDAKEEEEDEDEVVVSECKS